MSADLSGILAQIPQWAKVPDLQVEPLGGLTNTNYRVTVAGERFVLRVNGDNSKLLEINREVEFHDFLPFQTTTCLVATASGPES
jgi:thiamine kinase-like enzyme